jgi:hypothetical protein
MSPTMPKLNPPPQGSRIRVAEHDDEQTIDLPAKWGGPYHILVTLGFLLTLIPLTGGIVLATIAILGVVPGGRQFLWFSLLAMLLLSTIHVLATLFHLMRPARGPCLTLTETDLRVRPGTLCPSDVCFAWADAGGVVAHPALVVLFRRRRVLTESKQSFPELRLDSLVLTLQGQEIDLGRFLNRPEREWLIETIGRRAGD